MAERFSLQMPGGAFYRGDNSCGFSVHGTFLRKVSAMTGIHYTGCVRTDTEQNV